MTRALVFFALLLAGCESDEAKLQRLQGDAALARGTVLRYEQELEAVATSATGAGDSVAAAHYDSVSALLDEAKAKATLAERDLARFLR
jgi:outer membrane murein-binding lipoprotein Lpp